MTLIFEKIYRWCLYGALLLTPLFFLPTTIFPLALNKQILLLALVSIGFLSWLACEIAQNKVIIPRGHFNYLLLGLIIFSLASAWLSGAHSVGLWGATGGEVNTFVNLLSFGLLFCLSAAVFKEEKHRKTVIGLVLVSSAVILIYSFLQLLGLHIFPWEFTQRTVFNPIGTTNALAIYLGIAFVLAFSLSYLNLFYKKSSIRIALIVLAAALFLLGFLINFWVVFAGWALMAILLLFIDSKISSASLPNKKILFALAVIVVALVIILTRFNIIPIPLPTFNVPGEVVPSASASWQIAKNTLGEGFKNILFGAGPATYQNKYALYKSVSLNATPLWNTYFIQGFSAVFTHLTEDGVLGSILWISFILSVIASGFALMRKFLLKRRQDYNDRLMFWGIILALGFLLISFIFYTQNFVNYFMLFALSGMLVGLVSAKENNYSEISLTDVPYRPLVAAVLIILVIAVIVFVLFLQIQHYRGSNYFKQAIAVTDETKLDEALNSLLMASDFDSRNEVYLRALSDAHLLKIKNLFDRQAAGEITNPQEVQTEFINNLDAAIQASQKATEVNKLSGASWINLAKTYENVISLVSGAADQSYSAYEEAAKLEPTNPIVFANFGRSYIADEKYDLAIEKLKKAIGLKGNYAPARYWLGVAYQRSGDRVEAFKQAEIVYELSPDDPDVKKLYNELNKREEVE